MVSVRQTLRITDALEDRSYVHDLHVVCGEFRLHAGVFPQQLALRRLSILGHQQDTNATRLRRIDDGLVVLACIRQGHVRYALAGLNLRSAQPQ